MSLTTHDAYPESIEDIDAMVEENKRMKLLIRNLLKRTGSDGATSTALVRSSAWDQAPSVDAVQAMRDRAITKTPKGKGKRAAAQASGDDSDGSGPIAKKPRKQRNQGPKKELTPYTYYVQQMRSVCFDELAAQRADDEAEPNNGEVMSLIAVKWNKVKENKEEHDRVKEERDTFMYYAPQIESACFDELAAQQTDGKKPKKPTEKEVKQLIVLKWKKVVKNQEEYNKVKAEKVIADAKVGEKASPDAMPTDASPTSVVDDDGF